MATADPMMPDLSHLSEEERAIIEQVLARQRAEEQKEEMLTQKADKELEEIERQINGRKENAMRLVGTQDDAICQICQKTKFADGIGHKCFYCQLRSCARCGGRTTSKNKNIWACSLCQKRQQILARTGKWFQTPSNAPGAAVAQQIADAEMGTYDESSLYQAEGGGEAMDGRTGPAMVENHQPVVVGLREPSQEPVTDASVRKLSAGRRQSTLKRQPSLQTTDSQLQFTINQVPSSPPTAIPTAERWANGGVQRSSRGPQSTSVQQDPPHLVPTARRASRQAKTAATPAINLPALQKPDGQLAPQPLATAPDRRRSIEGSQRKEATAMENERGRASPCLHASVEEASPMCLVNVPAVPASSSQQSLPSHQIPRQLATPDLNNKSLRRSRHTASASTKHHLSAAIAAASPLSTSEDDEERSFSVMGGGGGPGGRSRVDSSSVYMGKTGHLPATHTQRSRHRTHQQPPPVIDVLSTTATTSSAATASGDFSEKDLLRYIYGSQQQRKSAAPTARGVGQRSAFLRNEMDSARGHSPSRIVSAGGESSQLAAAIRAHLQSSSGISWQPSADGQRLIGHVVLSRASSDVDFGLKVVGGRCMTTSTGQVGAFITRVKPGSLADIVGRLRPGDEVLEWGGNCLQNISHDAVCHIINASRYDAKLELIVSRSTATTAARHGLDGISHSVSGGWPTGAFHHLSAEDAALHGGASAAYLPHSQSLLITPSFNHHMATLQGLGGEVFPPPTTAYYSVVGAHQPVVTTLSQPQLPSIGGVAQSAGSHLCGRIEISLCYRPTRRELVVNLHRAFGLAPRANGMPRNPYVKLFLLPDRSEFSRRQSSVLGETLEPVWEESFVYHKLTEQALMARALEVTLWDWDKFDANAFLGELLIDTSQTPLEGQPLVYPLLDMDEESPIRLRLRQRRSKSASSSYTPPPPPRPHITDPYYAARPTWDAQYSAGDYYDEAIDEGLVEDYYYPPAEFPHYDGDDNEHHSHPPIGRRALSQTDRRRAAPHYDFSIHSCDWNKNSRVEGYLSDTYLARSALGLGSARRRQAQGRPRSAAALRRSDYRGCQFDGGDQARPAERAALRGRARQEVLQHHLEQAGEYGSDGSETLSVNSAQSMQNRAARQRVGARQRRYGGDSGVGGEDYGVAQPRVRISNRRLPDATDELEPSEGDYALENCGEDAIREAQEQEEEQALYDQQRPLSARTPTVIIEANMGAKGRKKGLMTRLIPGRTGPSDASRRMGFARSEEVGLGALQVPGTGGNPEEGGGDAGPLLSHNPSFIKQASKESTDSSDKLSWLPIHADKPLGSFVESLGQGQVVGRQALGSVPLGELEVGLSHTHQTGLIVHISKARNLTLPRSGGRAGSSSSTRGMPAVYVKVYLLDGRNIVAKAKTQPTARGMSAPVIEQRLLFSINPREKMLQLSVLGDYGRMERKAFMGVLQVNLDSVELRQQESLSWYKLFASNSLLSTALGDGGS